jgi:hypothetical protein
MAIFGKKKAPQEKPEDIRKAEEAKTKKVASKKNYF